MHVTRRLKLSLLSIKARGKSVTMDTYVSLLTPTTNVAMGSFISSVALVKVDGRGEVKASRLRNRMRHCLRRKRAGSERKLALTRLYECLSGEHHHIHQIGPLGMEKSKSIDGSGVSELGKCIEIEDVCSSDWKESSPRLRS